MKYKFRIALKYASELISDLMKIQYNKLHFPYKFCDFIQNNTLSSGYLPGSAKYLSIICLSEQPMYRLSPGSNIQLLLHNYN